MDRVTIVEVLTLLDASRGPTNHPTSSDFEFSAFSGSGFGGFGSSGSATPRCHRPVSGSESQLTVDRAMHSSSRGGVHHMLITTVHNHMDYRGLATNIH